VLWEFHTTSTDTKSSSCSRPSRPKRAFRPDVNMRWSRMKSMVLIEFSRWEEHLGSAETRMTSIYCQFEKAACVTAIKISRKVPECTVKFVQTNHWKRWNQKRDRDRGLSCARLVHQRKIPENKNKLR